MPPASADIAEVMTCRSGELLTMNPPPCKVMTFPLRVKDDACALNVIELRTSATPSLKVLVFLDPVKMRSDGVRSVNGVSKPGGVFGSNWSLGPSFPKAINFSSPGESLRFERNWA